MASSATIHRFDVDLSDVDRGVYESLELRVARHPSESARHLVGRVLAYCARYEEGIEFGRGVSTAEEPAIWIRDPTGMVTAWIEMGTPSAERLHRASKTGARVFVYAHKNPEPMLAELARSPIFRQDELEVWLLPDEVLDPLEAELGRNERWSVTLSDEHLYATRGDETHGGPLVRASVASSDASRA